LQRYGAAALLLSWLPLVGDALCVAAGWLRLPWWSVVFFLCVGKTLRYLLLALPFVLL
jgi:membrane protein YqaA with SNARE-associated domain